MLQCPAALGAAAPTSGRDVVPHVPISIRDTSLTRESRRDPLTPQIHPTHPQGLLNPRGSDGDPTAWIPRDVLRDVPISIRLGSVSQLSTVSTQPLPPPEPNRALSSAEGVVHHLGETNEMIGFNGAALFRARSGTEAKGEATLAIAASTGPRSFERGVWVKVEQKHYRQPLLQRGRALSSAECQPRQSSEMKELGCFNGAALFRARSVDGGQPKQWSSDPASTGPRSFERGVSDALPLRVEHPDPLQRGRALSSAECNPIRLDMHQCA